MLWTGSYWQTHKMPTFPNEPILRSGPEKNAQSLMHRHSATICSRITTFSPKCSEINW